MNKPFFLIIAILIVVIGCKSQEKVVNNISCSEEVTVQYDRIKPGDIDKPESDKNLDTFMVYFLSDFNDSIRAYVNDEIVFEKHVKIGGNSHSLDYYFGYNFLSDSSVPILKVQSLTAETCFDILIESDYKLIYLFLNDEEEWTIRFSNIYYLH